jgi:adenosine deaminase CECR1
MSSTNDYSWYGLEKYTNSFWSLIKNNIIFPLYFEFILEEALKENIKILEIKSNIGSYFEFKKINIDLDKINIYEKIWNPNNIEYTIIENLVEKYKKVGLYVYMIVGRHRGKKGNTNNIKLIEKMCELNKYGNNLIRGIDIFGEEDISADNLEYKKVLEACDANLYIHSGESTNTPQNEKNINLAIALELNKDVKVDNKDLYQHKKVRVGHGLELIKSNELMDSFKEKKIHVELCPLSNYILGYVKNISNHPGKTFIKNGIRVSINGDDQGIYGYNHVSVDWLYIILSWGLSLEDIYTISKYTIEDSSCSLNEKDLILKNFNKEFNEWKDKNKYSFDLLIKSEKIVFLDESGNIKSIINFKEKYLKYKNKYLNLKNIYN